MSSKESDLERAVVQYAKKLGYLTIKITPSGQRGWPDHLFITEGGVHLYMEFKQEGKELTGLQEFRATQLRERYIPVYGPVDTVIMGKAILDEWKDAHCDYY